MEELIGELLARVLYVGAVVVCIGIFLCVIAVSLVVGAVGGIGVGLFHGFANYFSALAEEIRLRK